MKDNFPDTEPAQCKQDKPAAPAEVAGMPSGALNVDKLAAKLACKVWEISPIGSIGRMELTKYIREEIEAALLAATPQPVPPPSEDAVRPPSSGQLSGDRINKSKGGQR